MGAAVIGRIRWNKGFGLGCRLGVAWFAMVTGAPQGMQVTVASWMVRSGDAARCRRR